MAQRIEVPGRGIVEFPDGMSETDIASAIQRDMQQKPVAGKQPAPAVQNIHNATTVYDPVSGVPLYSEDTSPTPELTGVAGVLDRTLRGAAVAPVAFAAGASKPLATVLSGVEHLKRKATGQSGKTLSSLITGQDVPTFGREMSDAGSGVVRGLSQESPFISGASNFAGEITSTAGVPKLLGAGVGKLPMLAKYAPAIESGGFTLGNAATGSKLANAGIRAAGGAVSGGATAGLIDPDSVGMGAILGGAIPVVGNAAYSMVKAFTPSKKASPVSDQSRKVAEKSIDSGFVIPPSQLKPTMWNRILESFSGKDETKQAAVIQNAEKVGQLIREDLGLAADSPLNAEVLGQIRANNGKAYKAVSELPIRPAVTASQLENRLAKPEINPAKLVENFKQSSNDAQTWFKAYNASANPEHLAKAKAAEAMAKAADKSITDYATSLGKPELVEALKKARIEIAKTYTVERALNNVTGNINPAVLARLVQKNKPLTGGMRQVGEFASAFPTLAVAPERIGSPFVSKLQAGSSGLLGAVGGMVGGPVGIALGAAAPFVVPPVARSIMFSKGFQRGLLQPQIEREVADYLTSAGRYGLLVPPTYAAVKN